MLSKLDSDFLFLFTWDVVKKSILLFNWNSNSPKYSPKLRSNNFKFSNSTLFIASSHEKIDFSYAHILVRLEYHRKCIDDDDIVREEADSMTSREIICKIN